MGADGFGLNFHVRACVCADATISRICVDRFYSYLAQRQHMMGPYICTSFFFLQSDQRWLTGGHFSCKIPDVERVLKHFSDMHLSMSIKLGTQIRKVLHVCVILFRDQMQDSRLAAILWLKCVPNYFSDMHGPILFKLGTSTVHDGIHMHLTLFCDLNKDDRLLGWRPF